MMEQRYEEFEKRMAERFPRYCGKGARFGGYAIGSGWFDVIEALVGQIDHYTKWRRRMRAHDLRMVRAKARGRSALIDYIARGRVPTDWDIDRADQIMSEDYSITPKVNWIVIEQIKEKFGGLRFYYYGGDDQIQGMVTMAEIWAGRTCEKCGNKGTRRDGGWIRTLCDEHEAERKKDES